MEAVTALAWPAALIVSALAILVITFRLTSLSKDGQPRLTLPKQLKLKAPGGFELQYDPRHDEGLHSPAANDASDEPPVQLPLLATPTAPQAPAVAEPSGPSLVFTTKDSEEFARAFDVFRNTESFTSNEDFWESWAVRKRSELGVVSGEPEYEGLIVRNPSWAWPRILLIRRLVGRQAYAEAELILADGLAAVAEEKRSLLVSEGVALRVASGGRASALEFARQVLGKQLGEIAEASVLNRAAQEFEAVGDELVSAALREAALSRTPFDNNARFSAAYRFSQGEGLRFAALVHYTRLAAETPDHSYTLNNLAVAWGELDERTAQAELLEEALGHTPALSGSNLAIQLLEGGFISRAESVLNGLNPDDSVDQERFHEALRRVSHARRETRETKERIIKEQTAFYRPFQGAMLKAIDSWKDGVRAVGKFKSADASVSCSLAEASADLILVASEGLMTGLIYADGIGYSGYLSSEQKTLLARTYNAASVYCIGADEIVVVVLPSSAKLGPRVILCQRE